MTFASRQSPLDEALGLWRGSALADVRDAPFAEPQAVRLAEVRLTAVEDRAEAALVLGEPRAVLGILPETVAAHPLRERSRALLMRALYAAGRQAEALELFERGRQLLADELGADEVLRGDLAHLLFDITKSNVEYLFGDSVTGLQQQPSGVTVRFRNATPRVFDLVIGADGMHSAVRGLAFGPEEQFARHTGMAACVISVPNYLDLDHWELVHPTPGRVVQLYSTQRTTAKAQFIFRAPEQLPERRDRAAQQRLVADAFADAGWETPGLLHAMPESPDLYFDSVSQIHLDRWSTGRIALVGDAAYCPSPLSGQGMSMALVGAYVLAGELKAASGDHTAAFDGYQRAMQDYVTRNLSLGWSNATQMVAADRRAIRMQTTMLRMLRHLPWKGLALRPITKPLERAANAIELADY